MLISSFLQPFTGGLAQDVPCELSKGILVYHSSMGAGFPEMGHYVYFKL